VEQPGDDAGAGCADVMPERDRSAVHVHLRPVEPELRAVGQRVEPGPERALDGFLLEDRLHHEVGLRGGTDAGSGGDPVRDLPRGRGIQPALGDAPLQVAQDPRAARVCPGS
jgi:hypothetical protein